MSEVEKLRAYAREASIALMKLSGGGSEMFTKIGDEFYAEPSPCVQRAEHKLEMARKFGGKPALSEHQSLPLRGE